MDNSERILLKHNGEELNILKTARTIILDGKKCLIETFTDISDLKQAEKELQKNENKLQAITDSALDAIVMMEPEGCISYWNHAAENLFGYTSDEVIGRMVSKFCDFSLNNLANLDTLNVTISDSKNGI